MNKVKVLYTGICRRLNIFAEDKMMRNALWVFVVFAILGIMLVLNIFTPMAADDFGYLYIHGEGIRLTSLTDVIHSQYNHYMLWGGRSVVHFIAQALLLLPPLVIDILNSLMYMLYTYLIYLIIKGRGANSISLYIFVNMAIWFVQPAFGDTILWITGSANYLWGTTIILLFLLPFRFHQGNSITIGRTVVYSALFLLYGLLAGWSNENTAGAMLLIAILFLIHYRRQGWSMPMWAITGLIGASIGYMFMVLAPGNAIRAGEAGHLGLFIICYRLFMHTLTLFTSHGILILFYLIILILYWRFSSVKQKREPAIFSIIFMLGALGAIYVMVLSPSFPARAWFGILSYMIIAIGILFYNLDFRQIFIHRIRLSLLTIGSIAFFFSFYLATKDIGTFYTIYKSRQVLVDEALNRGDSVCEFDRYEASTKFVHTEEELSNFMMEGYYGIKINFRETLRK